MTRPQRHDLTPIYRGERISQPFVAKDAAGVVVDLSGKTIEGRLKAGYANIDPVLVPGTITAIDLVHGSFSWDLSAVETTQAPAIYWYEIWIIDAGSEQVLSEGEAAILDD
jgi:hypothetical protein